MGNTHIWNKTSHHLRCSACDNLDQRSFCFLQVHQVHNKSMHNYSIDADPEDPHQQQAPKNLPNSDQKQCQDKNLLNISPYYSKPLLRLKCLKLIIFPLFQLSILLCMSSPLPQWLHPQPLPQPSRILLPSF